ncbi:MAG: hypothetical protein JRN06_01100 [Nitrososphaerota archaeon]|nr:hypothetical protein [Nitrososphaerota archaeon]
MVTAAETAFKTPTLGSILLRLRRTDSIVSGMPCPIILGEPYLIRSPAMRPPEAGRTMTSNRTG